ncbi:hypothetical protein [Norway mononegavirus 1]|uniref:Uncharacterized protein n=1 Tax=Norway mononegavirus 1 TaxID=2034335 RepID=A0A286N607_9RHAB|nr:hypothetical protein [Norway mononegavirus 1]
MNQFTLPSAGLLEAAGSITAAGQDYAAGRADDELHFDDEGGNDRDGPPQEDEEEKPRGHKTLGDPSTYLNPALSDDDDVEDLSITQAVPGDHEEVEIPAALLDRSKSPETLAAEISDFIFGHLKKECLVSSFETLTVQGKVVVHYRKMPLPSPTASGPGSVSSNSPVHRPADPYEKPAEASAPKEKPPPIPPTTVAAEEVGLNVEPFRTVYKYPNKFSSGETLVRMNSLSLDKDRIKEALIKRGKLAWFNDPKSPLTERAIFATWFGGRSKILAKGAKVAFYKDIVS